jgi:hypothetical protein
VRTSGQEQFDRVYAHGTTLGLERPSQNISYARAVTFNGSTRGPPRTAAR